MPIQLNVGLSRKLSKDYNSHGFSINVDAELPATAIDDPNEIAERADYLFRLATDILDEQVNATGTGDDPPAPSRNGRTYANGTGRRNGTGRNGSRTRSNGSKNGSEPRPMTDAQRRAITKMARKVGTDAEAVAYDEFGTELNDLDIKQASSLIDNLKDEIESAAATGNRS